MPLARLQSIALLGLDALPVDVEVDVVRGGEKAFLVIVGLPDNAVRESKDRVLAAIRNSGYSIDQCSCTINLAPGDLKKEGSFYDLPIALGLLLSFGLLPEISVHEDYLFVGELALSGHLRPIQGTLAIALLAQKLGKKGILLPSMNAKEAAAVPGIHVIPVAHLKEAAEFLKSPASIPPLQSDIHQNSWQTKAPLTDFADIKGQIHVKRAMEIAAAGGHNVILSGPPGSGKTMIAKAFAGILPSLTLKEALETTKIHSIAGTLTEGQSMIMQRPFRSPHHTISYAGLIGGGAIPRPGEVSLAHNGVLFLDELPEFGRHVLEVLRQPLEDGLVTISRANGNFTFPTRFICVAAMNPCPCGFLGHPDKVCKDSPIQVNRYQNKISGPLRDRIDMFVEVPTLRYKEIMETAGAESSSEIRKRVVVARERQLKRFGIEKTNSCMIASEIKRYVPLSSECHQILQSVVDHLGISARACARLIRVARTIADLAEEPEVTRDHLMESISFRGIEVV